MISKLLDFAHTVQYVEILKFSSSLRMCVSQSLSLSLFLSLFLFVLNMCAFFSKSHHQCYITERWLLVNVVGRVCRFHTRYLTRRLNTRGGCFRERKRKYENPKARRFRASI